MKVKNKKLTSKPTKCVNSSTSYSSDVPMKHICHSSFVRTKQISCNTEEILGQLINKNDTLIAFKGIISPPYTQNFERKNFSPKMKESIDGLSLSLNAMVSSQSLQRNFLNFQSKKNI